ncbi:MAG: hypothetical protein ACM3JC_15060 [Rudaea sp.]
MNDFVRPLPKPATAGAVAERIAAALVIGNPDRPIDAIGALSATAPGALAFCDDASGAALLHARAAVVIVAAGITPTPRDDQTFVAVDDVRAAFIDTVAFLLPGCERPDDPLPGIDPRATVDATAQVSPLAAIAAGVSVGARTRIGPGAVVYGDTDIGAECVVGAGTVIGWVGLAYHDARDGRRRFFPHLAGVRIGDRVDVGAQACICRGMLSHTSIGDDVKIGSLVYVSHGVVVEPRAWLSAGTAIAGHARIAMNGLLGIGSVVVDNVCLNAGVRVGAGSVVTKSAPAGQKLYGVPAHPVPAMRGFGPTPRD